MIAARPLTGWGEDTTGLAYGQFLSRDWSPGVTFDRAHSGPLDIAATQGLIGLAALGWLLLVVSRRAWRRRAARNVGVTVPKLTDDTSATSYTSPCARYCG